MSPLELAILTQLVQGDDTLNEKLKLACASFCLAHEQERRTEEQLHCSDSRCVDEYRSADGNGTRNSRESHVFPEGKALQNAASAYQELLKWSSLQHHTSTTHSEETFSSVGAELLDNCRRLGYATIPCTEPAVCTVLNSPRKPVKVFCDGVFDMVHAGHFNAIRQAAQLGDELYVGLCSDQETLQAKGVPPILSLEERAAIIASCKWVSGVILNTPYDIDLKFFATTGCQFVVHGDDVALNSLGVDCYEEIRKAGLLKIFKRTEGISTTRIIARLLARAEDYGETQTASSTDASGGSRMSISSDLNHRCITTAPAVSLPSDVNVSSSLPSDVNVSSSLPSCPTVFTSLPSCPTVSSSPLSSPTVSYPLLPLGPRVSCPFLPSDPNVFSSLPSSPTVSCPSLPSDPEPSIRTAVGPDSSPSMEDAVTPSSPDFTISQAAVSTRRLAHFIGCPKSPLPGNTVVYVSGSFDIFHTGHLRVFEKAKTLGDFLIVGIHDDETVRSLKGRGYPIQPMLHRMLSVMAIRHVDEVVMGVPLITDENFIRGFQINIVLRGSPKDTASSLHRMGLNNLKGVCEVIEISTGSSLTTRRLVQRIKENKDQLTGPIAKRQVREEHFYNDMTRVRCHEL